MASIKQYAYYIRGQQLLIVEKDTSFDNNIDNKDYGPGVQRQLFTSPLTAVTDGLEISYCYSPKFRYNDFNIGFTGTAYTEEGGYLNITNASHGLLANHGYVYIRGSERINGLHKITAVDTNDITFSTKYSGAGATEEFTVHTDIDVIDDEEDSIPVSSYLSKALVYYVKARIAEDMANIEAKEYFMREFKKMVEKHESSRISGPRMIVPGSHAIR